MLINTSVTDTRWKWIFNNTHL